MVKKFKVIWSDFAVKQLDLIFEYYTENASEKMAKKLTKNLLQEPERLIKNNQIGQIEELLVSKNKLFRYLIYKNYKIIYLIDQKECLIKIYDLFDTRQNPIKIEINKKL